MTAASYSGNVQSWLSTLASTLPVTVPLVLTAINTIAEPKGGWENIPKKSNLKPAKR
jgi:hypothetical protein